MRPLHCRHRQFAAMVGLIGLMLLAACGGDNEGTPEPAPPAAAETGGTTTAEAVEPAAEASLEIQLEEENDSGQTGTARLTPKAEGVGITVEVESAQVPQFALVASGTCESLREPFASIEASGEQEVTGGTKSGRFEATNLTALADGTPVALTHLQGNDFAVLVIDASYRGGAAEEIPPDVHAFQGSDPAGPYGETPYAIAACGDVPPSS